ncbi:MAG TPA: prepilin-type N-terminal cleavage/methylation domain-containing protein [Planctomycetota bacterium]|nr:prepilin-type N-terminal cleavage/methylation domain-containing protein [Planctomycetota bacterium]
MKRQSGFTLIELMIVVAIIAIIAAIAIPSLLKARIAGNEASAISSLRTLTTVNEQYRTRFGEYADALGSLSTTGYIDTVLSSGTKSGFTFAYTGGTDTWNCTADPTTVGTTGDRFFYADQTGVIRVNQSGTAGDTDPPIE